MEKGLEGAVSEWEEEDGMEEEEEGPGPEGLAREACRSAEKHRWIK